MNRNALIAGFVIVLVIIGALYFVLPLLGTGLTGNMAVQFYNDGQAVTDKSALSFMSGGVAIDEIQVTLGWTSTGDTGVDISITGTVELWLEGVNGPILLEVKTFKSIAYAAEEVVSFLLSDQVELDPQGGGPWTLIIKGLLEGTATYADGSSNTATWPADGNPKSGTLIINWVDTADVKTFSLQGYWSY